MRTLIAGLMLVILMTSTLSAGPKTRAVYAVGSAITRFDTVSLASVARNPFTVKIWNDGAATDTLLVLIVSVCATADTSSTQVMTIYHADGCVTFDNVNANYVRTKAKSGTVVRRIVAY